MSHSTMENTNAIPTATQTPLHFQFSKFNIFTSPYIPPPHHHHHQKKSYLIFIFQNCKFQYKSICPSPLSLKRGTGRSHFSFFKFKNFKKVKIFKSPLNPPIHPFISPHKIILHKSSFKKCQKSVTNRLTD